MAKVKGTSPARGKYQRLCGECQPFAADRRMGDNAGRTLRNLQPCNRQSAHESDPQPLGLCQKTIHNFLTPNRGTAF